ncbi:calcium homeostasis modulator protein 6 isoform X1 [Misgurnus anguillicaudatus]|uniref:calcium homeostasis modulator protein 6 isoform X1 n=1 Tax=Misgurnus anguillicaudatus TaxID=75329 RepID=UPI002435A0EC|nr:calcium homeostasis modulator protein 6 isoform X1 [Misgurnus anguillicaudatus]
MDKLKPLITFTQKQQSNLGFGLITLLTVGSEHIFSAFAFKCPCNDWNFVYGNVCLLVPALALLILSYMLSNKTWKLVTGLCHRKYRLCRIRYAFGFLCVFLQITTTAMVAPLSWIAVALLKGVYFECSMTGANVTLFRHQLCSQKFPHCWTELEKFPCDGTSIPQSERMALLTIIRAESQVLGWLLIASVATFAFLLTCLARCYSPISYMQLKFWRMYSEKESDYLDSFTSQHAEKLAKRNLTSFFELTKPIPMKNPPKRAWEKISSFYKYRSMNDYYSILHKYVSTCEDLENPGARASVKSENEFSSPAALAFLDDDKLAL